MVGLHSCSKRPFSYKKNPKFMGKKTWVKQRFFSKEEKKNRLVSGAFKPWRGWELKSKWYISWIEKSSLIQRKKNAKRKTKYNRRYKTLNLKDWTAERHIKCSRYMFCKKKWYFFTIIKTIEIKRICHFNKEGFTDSKEENCKEKDQIQLKLESFESERLNCWKANQMLPPHVL